MIKNDLENLIFDKPNQCNQCGGKLNYEGIGHYKCIECGNILLDDYGILREYFEKNGPTPMLKLSLETGLSREKLQLLIKHGTLDYYN